MHTGTGRIRRALAVTAATVLSFAIPDASRPVPLATAPQTPAPPAWEPVTRRAISEREYEASDAGEGLQAPNRAHGLRTFFAPEGARVVGRESATEIASLRTVSLGAREVGPGEVVVSGAHVEIRRPEIVEWFVNSERGLEHGWTVAERPGCPLSIEVAFDTAVRVDGERATVGGLKYSGLAAWDARGTLLAARMESAGDERLRITVDDAEAVYPVKVDPTLTSPVYTTLTSTQVSAVLGYAVASAGDVNGDGFDDLVVGAPSYDAGEANEGAAFVFLGGPNGIASADASSASARLESNQASAHMGTSVAGTGDVNRDGYDDVVVGARFYDSGQTDEGAAFVFLGGPSGIPNGTPASAIAVLQGDQNGALMGVSVAGAGDVNGDGFDDVAVGAPSYDAGQTDEGAAFVFLGGPGGVQSGTPASADTVLQSDQALAGLGEEVASAGDVNGDGFDEVLVGARLYGFGQIDEGAAFLFLGGAAGVVNGSPATADATFKSNQALAELGASVGGVGDVNGDGFDDVAVGAPLYDAGQADEGVALLFFGGPAGTGDGNPATVDVLLQADQGGANFGISVVRAGDVDGDGVDDLLVGADGYDAGSENEGGLFVYFGRAAGAPGGPSGSTAPTFLQQDQSAGRLGWAAGAGDFDGDGFADVAAGAFLYDFLLNSGAVFVYTGAATGLRGFPAPDFRLGSGQAGADFGRSVAAAGDVNSDGFDDVLVGAPFYDAGEADEGAVFVFHGSPAGIPSGGPAAATTLLQGDQAGASFGAAVAGGGDVNGDGFDDVVVGAPSYDAAQTNEGATFVFHGGPAGVASGSPATADAVLRSDQGDAAFGADVSLAGDVDKDGFDDVVVGASLYDTPQSDAGAAFVFHGGAAGVGDGTPADADVALLGEAGDDHFGISVAEAGDVNADSYADVLIGRDRMMDSIAVYHGGPGGLGTLPASSILYAAPSGLAGVGDVNADGYDDVAVVAASLVAVIHGSPAGLPNGNATSVATTTITANHPDSEFGNAVASAGDVNGDGYADLAVAAGGYVSGSRLTAFVFLGGPGGISAMSALDAAATVTEAGAGTGDVAGAGDVDGDGFDDLVAGFPGSTASTSNEGTAMVYRLTRIEVAPGGTHTVGIYIGSSGFFFLRNTNAPGSADAVFGFGPSGLGWVALSGDWDGDGDDTVGLYAPSSGFFFLRNSNAPGNADLTFGFGPAGLGWVPVVGDWDGDGDDTIGLYAPSSGFFFLRNQNAPGNADLTFGFGPAGLGWAPVVGDWDGDGDDTIGLYDPFSRFFFLRNQNAPGNADLTFGYGPSGLGWLPLTGDWDGNGDATVGLYAPSNGFFFLRNRNAPGNADLTFGYGPSNVTPLVGDWDGQ